LIVVDTNVVAAFYLPGPHSLAAHSLRTQDPDWVAPWLWRSEFRNVLAGYLRRGALTFARALAIQQEAEGLLAGAEYEVDSVRVLELVQASRCTAYDCEFVALAMAKGTRLVTLDRQVREAFPAHTSPLTSD
jgi:predicted nucleic acid-binding protein